MTWDGNSLWHVNRVGNDGVLHQVSRNGALLEQWTFSGLEFIDGLAFDGSNLWLGNTCCGDTYGLYWVDPGTGNIIQHYQVRPGWGNTNDLTWDGEFLWVASIAPYRLYKLNLANGETVSSLPGPIPPDYDGPLPDFDGENNTDLVLGGLTWDGEFLWVSESSTNTVMKIDPGTGAIVSYFIANQRSTTLTWDGTYILIGSFSNSTITRYSPSTGDTPVATDEPSVYTSVKLTLVTGDDGTIDNLVFKLHGEGYDMSDGGKELYSITLDQPGDLQAGQTDVYEFSVPFEFCELEGWSLIKPDASGPDDPWMPQERYIELNGQLISMDRDFSYMGAMAAGDRRAGNWTGTAAYQENCGN
jgi:hypothetical protein